MFTPNRLYQKAVLSSLVLVTPRPRNKSGGGRFELGGGCRALLGLVVRGGVLKKRME